uniref:Polymerase nucleotidyl transferase domain-containing protein n=1 Tax=Parascaris equorum TaxID=6256 RepID=A0A914RDC4_PAREQ
MLYCCISPVFPMCGLYVVGSSLNGFGNNSSDMDLCLMISHKDPFTEITVDLNANNSVAIRNTHLLCYYSSLTSDFPIYFLFDLIRPHSGANPAVLPSLQELYPKRFNHRIDVRTLNVSVPLEPPATGEWQFSEANTL